MRQQPQRRGLGQYRGGVERTTCPLASYSVTAPSWRQVRERREVAEGLPLRSAAEKRAAMDRLRAGTLASCGGPIGGQLRVVADVGDSEYAVA